MQKTTIYLTKEGLEKLKEELKELKEVKVAEVAKRIKNARDHGDISENSEYDDAKHEQAVVEGKIKELEEIIKNAEVTENTKSGSIGIGSKVTVHIDGTTTNLHIVGAMEANPVEKRISHESPIGAALMGKKPGDKVEIQAPVGTLVYTIVAID